jgi:hypothetical protein
MLGKDDMVNASEVLFKDRHLCEQAKGTDKLDPKGTR